MHTMISRVAVVVAMVLGLAACDGGEPLPMPEQEPAAESTPTTASDAGAATTAGDLVCSPLVPGDIVPTLAGGQVTNERCDRICTSPRVPTFCIDSAGVTYRCADCAGR